MINRTAAATARCAGPDSPWTLARKHRRRNAVQTKFAARLANLFTAPVLYSMAPRLEQDMSHHHDTAEMDACIRACLECYRVCQETATGHCLETGGRHVEPEHFRLMLSCAEVCRTAAALMLDHSAHHQLQCGVCAEVCRACAQSCRDVGGMDECVAACEACAVSCENMIGGHA